MGSGWFEDDTTWSGEDCSLKGAVCVAGFTQVACVFHDQPCDGRSTCVGSTSTACFGGFISTRPLLECENGCEMLPALDANAHCAVPSDCRMEGEIRCVAPATNDSAMAHYEICLREGRAVRYSCYPNTPGDVHCEGPVADVPCEVRPDPDSDAGISD